MNPGGFFLSTTSDFCQQQYTNTRRYINKPQFVKLMEIKGMVDKIGYPGRTHFIGKKCLKFLEPNFQLKNTVSIVPIIGEYRILSGLVCPGFESYMEEPRLELF